MPEEKKAVKMACYVCQGSVWHDMGDIHSQSEILVCKTCGNVAHEVDVSKEEELKEFYRYKYRPNPNHANLLTTAHKRAYVEIFLREFLEERKGKSLITGDIGCATGYIPAWLRGLGHKATGCELTVNYRRFAEHFYGIPIPEELETKHKYDLITIYHVLEHLMEPDKKLAHYRSLLAEDGRILIATPEWLDTLEEASGGAVQSFDNLFHKNHINLFSANSLKNLFRRVGLEIVKEDHTQYGQTYLLKKADPSPISVVEPWERVVESLHKIKKAIEYHAAGKQEMALHEWSKFPEAWIALAMGRENKDPQKQAETFARALKVIPENTRLLMQYGTWLYMREDLKGAVAIYKEIEKLKPNEHLWMFMGYCYAKMGNAKEAARAFYQASEMNPTKWIEAMDNICALSVRLPNWEENAVAKMADKMVKEKIKSGEGPKLVDPIFESKEKTNQETTSGR